MLLLSTDANNNPIVTAPNFNTSYVVIKHRHRCHHFQSFSISIHHMLLLSLIILSGAFSCNFISIHHMLLLSDKSQF